MIGAGQMRPGDLDERVLEALRSLKEEVSGGCVVLALEWRNGVGGSA